MIIAFEKWVNSHIDIPESAKELFDESILCYKTSAYRSSFIMTYIGFQNILKNRILSAHNTPTGINQGWWGSICSRLGNEDEWDSTIAECVKRKNPDRVFLISDAIVSEYESFRVIRNKCAHGKSGKIDYYHIECFWNFIQENYYRFVINGGRDGILQEIIDHYDKTITPPGESPESIVNNIKTGVLDTDLGGLISDFYEYCVAENPHAWNIFSDRNRMIDLWDKLVNESDERIHNAVIRFIIESKNEEVCNFAGRYPSSVSEFLADPVFSRLLWTQLLFECKRDNEGFWNFLEKIIRENIVPETEREEFDRNLYKSVGKYFPSDKIHLLEMTSYFDRLKRNVFRSSDYDYPNGINHANSNTDAISHYLHYREMDKCVVVCINTIFSFASYGPFYDMIRSEMQKDELLAKYKEIVQAEGYTDYSEKFISEKANEE